MRQPGTASQLAAAELKKDRELVLEAVRQDGCASQHAVADINDAYRYVDWLLTVPLLLIELIRVIKLPEDEPASLGWNLGLASALIVELGYPGEIQDVLRVRWS